MKYDDFKTSWISNWSQTEKPWGFEMSWSSLNEVHGKLLFIKADGRTSFKYNEIKSETLIVLSGKIFAIHGNEKYIINENPNSITETIMTPGMILNIQSGCPYRLEAIDDSQIIEIGNNKTSLVTRLEDDYGRAENNE